MKFIKLFKRLIKVMKMKQPPKKQLHNWAFPRGPFPALTSETKRVWQKKKLPPQYAESTKIDHN